MMGGGEGRVSREKVFPQVSLTLFTQQQGPKRQEQKLQGFSNLSLN